jgi:hypothetical protein
MEGMGAVHTHGGYGGCAHSWRVWGLCTLMEGMGAVHTHGGYGGCAHSPDLPPLLCHPLGVTLPRLPPTPFPAGGVSEESEMTDTQPHLCELQVSH